MKGMVMVEEISRLLSVYEDRIYQDFERMVNINSFSSNRAGIEQMCQVLQEIAANLGVELERIYSAQKSSLHLVYGQNQKEHFYALMGHFDTVHPPESDFQTLREEEGLLYGPGANDMKSGLIVAIYSLAILQILFPECKLPIKALFNSDEEIGSSDSKALIHSLFVGAKAGFVFEPGRRENNSVVIERKGIMGIAVTIAGKPAHAGSAPWEGINAISEAAALIGMLDGHNDYARGFSVGCNVIHGGVASNVVAAECHFDIDVRYMDEMEKEALLQALDMWIAHPMHEGAAIDYRILHSRAPMKKTEASEALFATYKHISESLGIACGGVSSGGVSDANFLSGMGIPVIDGIGAVGDGSHTRQEYTIKHSIPDRIKIFSLLMAEEIKKQLGQC